MDKLNRNRREFLRDTRMYVVEALTKSTLSWQTLDDAGKEEKSKILCFEPLMGKQLYASFCRKGDESYAKLYIVSKCDVNILYIPSSSINPIKMYNHVP